MNKEVKDQWVAALRSGEYKQTTGALNRNNEFCCLGVLCELAVKAGVVTAEPADSDKIYMSYGASKATALLPVEVMDWSGVDSSGGFNPDDAGVPQSSLTGLNDFRHFNFDQIADAIEENF